MKIYISILALLYSFAHPNELLKLENGKIIDSNNKIINLKGWRQSLD